MTTNTSTAFMISRTDFDDETVEAEYFTANSEWVELKDSDHKVVCAFPARFVSRIKRVNPASALPGAAIKAAAEAAHLMGGGCPWNELGEPFRDYRLKEAQVAINAARPFLR
jgi:hypothetical protein